MQSMSLVTLSLTTVGETRLHQSCGGISYNKYTFRPNFFWTQRGFDSRTWFFIFGLFLRGWTEKGVERSKVGLPWSRVGLGSQGGC